MKMIYVTLGNNDEARKIGRELLDKKLANCVNFFPITCIYNYKNEITEEPETVLIIKTKKSKYSEIEKEIHKIHHSDTPCIFSIKIDQVNAKYYQWLVGEISETA